jgi:uncharacterized protein YdgA (DUF945 family)
MYNISNELIERYHVLNNNEINTNIYYTENSSHFNGSISDYVTKTKTESSL